MLTIHRPVLGLLSCLCICAAARATSLEYEASLNDSEVVATGSAGTGTAQVTYDTVSRLMRVQVTFSGLTGNTTASHIHAATAVAFTGAAGVATAVPTFTGFPLGVTAGSYDHTFDLTLSSSFNPAFITSHGGTAGSAEAALAAALGDGKSYLNIHTTSFPGGEIRGFLKPKADGSVPDNATTGLMLGLASALLFGFARHQRAQAA